MKTRLLKTYEQTDPKTLEDFTYLMAANMEDALLQGGAVPGKDYQLLDLYQLGMPLVLEQWKQGRLGFCTGYPNGLASSNP